MDVKFERLCAEWSRKVSKEAKHEFSRTFFLEQAKTIEKRISEYLKSYKSKKKNG